MTSVAEERRVGFPVKVLGAGGLPSHDGRRWQTGPDVAVSVAALDRILDYLEGENIRMYRMSSDFVPYATHPELPQFHRQIEDNAAELARVGGRAAAGGVRLSLHPSQFVVLNAVDDEIVGKSVWDLDSQARLLDAMEQGPESVVVLHVGGVYGDREKSRDRFARVVDGLPEAARRRLVIENDETWYTVEDCLWVHQRTGVPVVFDHQHCRLNQGERGPEEAARAALGSWPPGVVPKIHFSSPRLDGREVKRGKETRVEAPLLRQHADYIDPWTFAEFMQSLADVRFDVMLEAKAKDLALLKLRRDLATLCCSHVLHTPHAQD
jgi:UV DNA damage endonuclease